MAPVCRLVAETANMSTIQAHNNHMASRSPPENKSSSLLTKQENDLVFSLLGNKCQTLATTVVQVFHAEPPTYSRWTKQCCGVLCFVKDSIKRSYFLRVFDVDARLMVWEQELYNQFRYKAPAKFFHTFEGDNCPAGLNFADEVEAEKFQNSVESKIRLRNERRAGKRRTNTVINPPTSKGVISGIQPPVADKYQEKAYSGNQKKKDKKDKKRQRITKADIGEPTNFQHISHVGWDPNKGFDLENVDPKLMDFFKKAGVSESQLEDNDTRKFIYEFIYNHGGVEAAIQEISKNLSGPAPPIPARQAPNTPASIRAPPAIPARNTAVGSAPLPPPVVDSRMSPSTNRQMVAPPPPPPPSRPPSNVSKLPRPPVMALPPVPTAVNTASTPAPLPPSIPSASSIPPPPPPPAPPPMFDMPPPAPAMPSDSAPEADVRSALLNDIRSGLQLKPVQQETNKGTVNSRNELLDQIRQGIELRTVPVDAATVKPPTTVRNQLLEEIRQGIHLKPIDDQNIQRRATFSCPRDQLLADIRKGVELRPVNMVEQQKAAGPQVQLSGMAGALARALADRSRVIHSSDDSDSDADDDDEDDDEWDD